jgi:hypothetical protein
MITLSDIAARDWSMRLDPPEAAGGSLGEIVAGLEDVGQCIRLIVTTPKGTDPLRPDFACDVFAFVDRPTTLMRPHVVREIVQAITRYEPRVELLGVEVQPQRDQGGAHVAITIRWRLKVQGLASTLQTTTQVVLGGAV